MPVETRAMKRAREAQEAQGGNQTPATTATGGTTAATTTTAPRAPRKKATGTKGAKGTKSKGEAKGKKGMDKVQKSTKPKKGGIKAVWKANQKDKGKKVVDEIEKEKPESEPEPEPVSKGKAKAKGEVKGAKGVSKVPKSTKPKKGGIKAAWEAKQKGKGKKVADEAELEDQKPVSTEVGKGKEVAAGKADKSERKQVQTAERVQGEEKAVAAKEGKDEILQRFTRADLQEAGALESDYVEMPTLTDDIHPIWAPEKFHFSSATNETKRAEAYAAVSPALRLASIWIEQPQYEDFWATMWHGQYLKPGRLMRITRLREDQAKSLKKKDSEERLIWKELRDLASLEEFQCEWRFGQQALGTWAKTEERIDGFSGCVTTLHDDFEWLACSPQPSTTTSERLRFYFFLAINLVRELVQQVCRFKHREQHGDKVGPLDRSSVFYQSAEGAGVPLDVAWENFMFKGPIRQINSPTGLMAPDGLAVHHFRLKEDSERVYVPVRVEWISKRFSMGLWLADGPDEDATLPGLPDGSDVYARELVIN